jgi:Rrf2 family nitric oxide-sensitive transcriptional repressor
MDSHLEGNAVREILQHGLDAGTAGGLNMLNTCHFCMFKDSREMPLTTHTDFALRTLMYLATTGKRSTAAQVAQLYGVSTNHLAKVVNQLSRLGYIRCIRGVGGGIELAKQPGDIRLGEVVEAFEGNLHLLECVAIDDVCTIQSFCKLKGVLAEAERVQLEYLNGVTLADVAPTRRQFGRVASS